MFATVGDIRIYYERNGREGGEGPPLLFVSGTGSDLRSRPNVFDGPMARRFDTVAYDQRGLGRSSKPDRSYCMAEYGWCSPARLRAATVAHPSRSTNSHTWTAHPRRGT